MYVQNWLSITTAFFETLVFNGIILGWPSIQFVLEKEGHFSHLCRNHSRNNDGNISESLAFQNPMSCKESQASFNLVFTLTISILNICSFFLGYLLDRFGNWIFRSMMSIMSTFGLVLFTISSPNWSNLLYPAYILLGVSGRGFFLSNLQTANLASKYRGVIVTFLTGLIFSSSLVFFIVKKGYEDGINLTLMLAVLSFLTIFQWIRTFILMPQKRIPFPLPDNFKYGYEEWKCFNKPTVAVHFIPVSLVAVGASKKMVDEVIERTTNPGKTEASKSFKTCLKTALFWTNLFYSSAIVFVVTFAFGSMPAWLSSFSNTRDLSKLIDDFGIMLFFAAFVATLNGIIFDAVIKWFRKTTSDLIIINLTASMISLIVTYCLCMLLCVMLITFNPYGTFIFLLFTASFVNGGNATFISINFPVEHIGKLFGLSSVIRGLIGLLQYALFQLAVSIDPTFFYINIGLLVVVSLTAIHPILIYKKIRKLKTTNSNCNVGKYNIQQAFQFAISFGAALFGYDVANDV